MAVCCAEVLFQPSFFWCCLTHCLGTEHAECLRVIHVLNLSSLVVSASVARTIRCSSHSARTTGAACPPCDSFSSSSPAPSVVLHSCSIATESLHAAWNSERELLHVPCCFSFPVATRTPSGPSTSTCTGRSSDASTRHAPHPSQSLAHVHSRRNSCRLHSEASALKTALPTFVP